MRYNFHKQIRMMAMFFAVLALLLMIFAFSIGTKAVKKPVSVGIFKTAVTLELKTTPEPEPCVTDDPAAAFGWQNTTS